MIKRIDTKLITASKELKRRVEKWDWDGVIPVKNIKGQIFDFLFKNKEKSEVFGFTRDELVFIKEEFMVFDKDKEETK